MIQGILLAAGRGTRFGGDKLLAPLPGGSSLAAASARALTAVLPRCLAVLRPNARPLAGVLAGLGLEVVVNRAADDGMGGSLALGVRASPRADGWLIALADMPSIQPASIAAVAAALAAGAPLAAPVYGGRRGHPVGFGRRFYRDLSRLDGDRGARRLLRDHAADLWTVPVPDPGVLLDIDTREDWQALDRRLRATRSGG